MSSPSKPQEMALDDQPPPAINNPAAAATVDDDDDDPITATYPVFLNPSLPAGRQLLVLQHPNRTDEQPRPPPTELRIKARTGMVEVDMPVDSSPGVYDREKGIRWGRSLHASMTAKNGGSHGLAGGFGFGAVQARGGGGGRRRSDAPHDGEDDDVMIDWNEAVRQGKALTTQTLGGQYPEVNDVQYMVGVFQGKNLHLTPASTLVHLRPQLHHIDAATQQERRTAGGDSSGGGGTGAGGAGGAGGAAGGAKAIHMTVKATADADGVSTETMADRLRSAQSEQWRKLRYTDENDEAAWEVYNESLFLQPKDGEAAAGAQPAAPVPAIKSTAKEDKEGKDEEEEKKKEPEEPELEGHVPRFVSKWHDDQLLEAVSGISKRKEEEERAAAAAAAAEIKPDPEARRQAAAAAAAAQRSQQQAAEQAARPAARPTRPRGGAAAARRGGRPKA